MGWLSLTDGRLQFIIDDQVIFDVNAASIQRVHYPWYYFSGGVKITAAGEEYRLSFTRPNGSEVAVGRSLAEAGDPVALLVALEKISDVGEGRAAGKRWREVLQSR